MSPQATTHQAHGSTELDRVTGPYARHTAIGLARLAAPRRAPVIGRAGSGQRTTGAALSGNGSADPAGSDRTSAATATTPTTTTTAATAATATPQRASTAGSRRLGVTLAIVLFAQLMIIL